MNDRLWTIYLAGEIHTNWRDAIVSGAEELELPVEFYTPVTDHGASDSCGTAILGVENKDFWRDQKSARLNAIRTRTMIEEADIVVVRFGAEFKQWNAAFDAGYAAANAKPLIVMHSPELGHALKEVDAAAEAVVETAQQVVQILRYITQGEV